MSTQTVYFNNPSDITTLQGQVGDVAGQVNTSIVNATTINPTMISSFSTTGSINNLSVNRFVDKYTINNGMGPYKVDAVPICFRDTFAMPKFSNNLSTSTGTIGYATTGVGGYHYTTTLFNTQVGHDMVVYLPSTRTTMQTTPVFYETGAGEPMNLGSWGITLSDWNGPIANTYSGTPATSFESFLANFGSTGLATAMNNFYILASSGTTSSTQRNEYLSTGVNHPDYVTIKNQIKYPFKTFNQVKLTSDFQFEQLYSLSGAALINTGADGVTAYPTQITSTTYAATGNLLPVASNVNAISNQMGLFIFHMGDGNNMYTDSFAHQIASWGYAVAFVPGTPLSQRVNKFGSTKSYAKLIADKDITNINTTYFASGAYINAWNLYNDTNDNLVSGAGTNGFWRTSFRTMLRTAPAQEVMERFYYQVKCVLNQIGVGRYIDYNNVVVGGISAGGYGIISSKQFISNGLSTSYRLNGGAVPLFTTKAYIFAQPSLFEYSQKVDAAASTNYNVYNNRFALGIDVLPCPLIAITTDADHGTAGSNTPFVDNRFNHTLQTVFQCTKQAIMNSTQQTIADYYAKSAVFYKPVARHFDTGNPSPYRTNDGQYSDLYNSSYWCEWLNGWYLNLKPQWPSVDNVYESGLQNEISYTMVNDIKINTVFELMAHRFLGREFPVPMSALQSFGVKTDIQPTHVEVIPEMEYLRMGPIAQMTYDNNYNVVFKNTPGASTAFNVVATGSNGIFKGISASTGAFTTSLSAPTIQNTTLNTTTVNAVTGAFSAAFSLPVYDIAGKPISGVVGQVIVISDSPTVAGKLAFWDTTNSRWSYVFDNSAVV